MWKRRLSKSMQVILAALVFAIPGISSFPETAEAKTILINLATNYPEPDIRAEGYRYWAKLLSEKSQGRIKLQIHYGGSLLPLPEIFNGLSQGVTQCGTLVASYMTGRVPEFTPFEIFYAYDADKWKAVDDEAKPLLDKITQRHNVKYLGAHYVGTVTVTSPSKFVKTLDDWNGLKVRTAGRWQAEAIQAWGGKPVSIALGEMYTSLQTGIVDAGLLVYSLIDSLRIYEVAPYLTHLGSVPQWSATGMNLQFWNSLSREDQKIIQETAGEMEKYLDAKSKELEPALIEKLKSKGAKVYRPSAEELSKLREKVKPIWADVYKIAGPDGKQLAEILQKYQ